MTYKDIPLKVSYKSVGEETFSEILNPMLKCTKVYKRSVGFFSSSALDFISEGILSLARNGGHIHLATSPRLNCDDIEAISQGYSERAIVEKSFLDDVKEAFKEITDENAKILYELVKEKIVDVKIVLKDGGMYHDKLAILEDFEGNIVACVGSNNESEPGYNSNYEKVRVYKSWFDQEGRIEDEVGEFDSIWSNENEALTVYDFMYAFESELLERVEHKGEYTKNNSRNVIELRDYQKEAISAWVNNNYHGFYVMATGTGKTWTAIFSAVRLMEEHPSMVVICAPYKHLVKQWAEDVIKAVQDAVIIMVSSENHNWEQQLTQAIVRHRLKKETKIIVISTITSFNLERFQRTIKKSKQEKLLIVDEAHRFTNRAETIKEQFQYMLGLSATPFSGKDTAKGKELMAFFGGQVYDLPIEKALGKFLVNYYYHPIFVNATEEEETRFRKKSAQIASCFRNGKCIDPENLALHLRSRLRIISMAQEKVDKIEAILGCVEEKDHFIVYCGDGRLYDDNDDEIRHIQFVKRKLSKLGYKASQFTASENMAERMDLVEAFNEGAIDALAAIRCLDEGINIPSITGALILSSNDDYREFVQRRGRILRTYGDKKYANIYDVIVLPSYETPKMAEIELRRFYEYARLSKEPEKLLAQLENIAAEYRLDIDTFITTYDDGKEAELDD